MKILNLYAGIGGNRALWGDEHEITAVERHAVIADTYTSYYPNDAMIVGDAHQYLLEHFKEFDFIWSSPPCPTHSKLNTSLDGWGINRYPDMSLYQEILLLKHFFKGKWIVENVTSYYNPLITPTTKQDRHYVWANFYISPYRGGRNFSVSDVPNETLADHFGVNILDLPPNRKLQRTMLRNMVDPKMGLHILNAALKKVSQETLV